MFGPIESTSAMSALSPLPTHPDTDIRPTLTSHLHNDVKASEINDRLINHQPKKPSEPPEMRFIKTPRRNNRSSNLSRYGSWGYVMLGMLLCSVMLLMCGIWECIRRVQKSDVLEQFSSNGEPMENMAHEREDDNNCPQYDPPPPYSSLFPIAKDCSTAMSSDVSAPSSIYFTTSSATFLPSAPSAPASIETHLPQSVTTNRNTQDDGASSPA